MIAAGSTGSQPATRELLSVIAALPQGAVVLPGLDRDMDDESWAKLDPTHPQFGLRELLGVLGQDRRKVADWPGAGSDPARRLLISELMRPAETSDAWIEPSATALDHVTRADCATPHQEAVVIALAMRESLEHPGRTAALVTPDRGLARRVAAELRRWDIEIDDSAGQPLLDTPPASFLRALLAAVDGGFAPVALLGLLKHPFSSFGLSRPALLDAARRLDHMAFSSWNFILPFLTSTLSPPAMRTKDSISGNSLLAFGGTAHESAGSIDVRSCRRDGGRRHAAGSARCNGCRRGARRLA